MEIPLVVLLLIYLAFVVFFIFFTAFNLLHVKRYAIEGKGIKLVTTLYIACSVIALIVSYIFIAQVDWSQSISIFNFSGTDSLYQL